MKKVLGILSCLILLFLGYIYYRVNYVKSVSLSEKWHIVPHSEGGFLIYSNENSEKRKMDYLNLDEIFILKSKRMVFIRNLMPNTAQSYEYKKFGLDSYEVYDIDPGDLIELDGEKITVQNLNYSDPWKIFIWI